MPILRKGDRAIHFSHVPRTGGRSILQAANKSGWRVERHIDGFVRKVYSHPYYSEEIERASSIPSFAIVRDPVDRFISATKYGGRCQNQDDVKSLINAQKSFPDTFERHFDPQVNFIGEKTIIYKYETQYEDCINALRIAGLILPEVEVGRVNSDAVLFEVNKGSIKSELMKVKKWYLDDYRAFGYDPTSL